MSDWIVVVDDEALSIANARNMLREVGMRVSCVRSGRELLAFMEKHEPDLVLLDVLMPEMDGFETYRKLRDLEERDGRKQTPVIFLTGENDAETERRGLEIGASDFVHKPFNKDILVRRINNTITSVKTIENLTEEVSVDALTGFFNKAGGTVKVEAYCAEKTGVLMILDLDSFKLVNDLYGHDMGDRILRAFAEIIRQNTREDDLVCRIGGDEFLAFFCNVPDDHAMTVIVKRLNEQLTAEAVKLMGEDFSIPLGISAGAVMIPEYGREYHDLFALADKMLYKVKQNGKHDCAVYTASEFPDQEKNEKTDLEQELKRVTQIVEERNDGSGALMLGQEAFSSIYRFVMRYIKRYQMPAVKVLFSLDMESGEGEKLEEKAEQFGMVLQETLRKSDLILQCKGNQFFLFLPALLEKHVLSVIDRVMKMWEQSGYQDGVRVQYVMKSVENEKNE
ncbi:MAG: diguanylate cyclase [Lachnospiraceae bacterium]|nr:diguanylate cyclase [Lachnospiraceae bacterium]